MYTGRLEGLPGLRELWRAVLALEDEDECYRFFDDLCTVSELKAMAQRYAVACLLAEGVGYDRISQRTGASSATISRVKRFLDRGSGGYRLARERTVGASTGTRSGG